MLLVRSEVLETVLLTCHCTGFSGKGLSELGSSAYASVQTSQVVSGLYMNCIFFQFIGVKNYYSVITFFYSLVIFNCGV